ncbi:hypothetical protein IU459_12040 [Nocardia amamiensis]|uniref:Uncharacterized protein n=1 Tax=Nocardia amamiensis TaxID=404578 RepID=A0ABS0CNT7_9NOCA|nr:hypothetical protein [Nocardia amamiensis]MBF6298272.1 hypothetical protein [Nocardia amamiensis]
MTHRNDDPLDRFYRLDDGDQPTEPMPDDDRPRSSLADEVLLLACGITIGAFIGVSFGLIAWGGGW